jgi:hypothetical protein
VVATSGRSFWILDNLTLLAQYDTSKTKAKLYNPEPIVYGNWRSSLSGNNDSFSGMQDFTGINPANGIELYYYLPEVPESTELTMTVTDANGKLINSYTSKKDENYVPHNGGDAPPAPQLSYKKGLNRFVWNMRHKIVPGVPGAYIEAGFRGHKVGLGTYTVTFNYMGQTLSKQAVIVSNSMYNVTPADYKEFDEFMSEVEANATEMHTKVNALMKASSTLTVLLKSIKLKGMHPSLVSEGETLLVALSSWDEQMVQRRSKAYDDVENFENKFTAEYLFLMNQTASSLPRVNNSSKDRKAELDAQWQGLRAEANMFLGTKLPAFNKKLWDAGYGAIELK